MLRLKATLLRTGQMFAAAMVAFGLLFVTWAMPAHAQSAGFKVPALTGPVVDDAHMFRQSQIQELSELLRGIAADGKVQIQVLTVPNLQGEEIAQASIQVTDKWKLGKSGKDNGILIMIAQKEHKMRIEVGAGLEGVVPDIYAYQIVENIMKPFFKQGQYATGTYAAILKIVSYADPSYYKQLQQTGGYSTNDYQNNAPFPLSKAILMILMLIFFGPWGFFAFAGGGFFGGGLGGGGFGGGGFGGGGWSGGGGGFNGGGASGGW